MVEAGGVALPLDALRLARRWEARAPDLAFGHRGGIHRAVIGKGDVGRSTGWEGSRDRFEDVAWRSVAADRADDGVERGAPRLVADLRPFLAIVRNFDAIGDREAVLANAGAIARPDDLVHRHRFREL